MGALSDDRVGAYVNEHFVTAYQKVGTFQVRDIGVNGRVQKNGGNVASYFCRPDGRVIHAVAGVIPAERFLSEARFAVEVHKMALTAAALDKKREYIGPNYVVTTNVPTTAEAKRTHLPLAYIKTVHAAHVERLRDGYGYMNADQVFGKFYPDDNLTDAPMKVSMTQDRMMWGNQPANKFAAPKKSKPAKTGVFQDIAAENEQLVAGTRDWRQESVSRMLAGYSLAGVDKLAPVIWTKVLHEKWSAAPVDVK